MKHIASVFDMERQLRLGDIILYPTDTVWGLGCLATLDAQISTVYKIKDRSRQEGIILLCGDLSHLGLSLDARVIKDIERMRMECATTFVVPNTNPRLKATEALDGSIAFRVVDESSYLSPILKRLGLPLLSTSANLKGKPAAQKQSELDPQLIQQVDGIVDFVDSRGGKIPSRILKYDLSSGSNWVILRS